ncbi:MAG: hypothetical protein IT477_11265 [Rhodanobacteraceae bacterium]|nr:hypothetical protein [Rhodanobacteraceae bacterium]
MHDPSKPDAPPPTEPRVVAQVDDQEMRMNHQALAGMLSAVFTSQHLEQVQQGLRRLDRMVGEVADVAKAAERLGLKVALGEACDRAFPGRTDLSHALSLAILGFAGQFSEMFGTEPPAVLKQVQVETTRSILLPNGRHVLNPRVEHPYDQVPITLEQLQAVANDLGKQVQALRDAATWLRAMGSAAPGPIRDSVATLTFEQVGWCVFPDGKENPLYKPVMDFLLMVYLSVSLFRAMQEPLHSTGDA